MLTNVEKIAQWRVQNPDEKVTESILLTIIEKSSLNGADLSGADLSHANLPCVEMRDVDFTGANLSRAVFTGADLMRSNLRDVEARYASFVCASLEEADMSDAIFSESDFTGATLKQACLKRSRLSNVIMSKTDLTGAGLYEADLFNAYLHYANLTKTCLVRTRLGTAFLSGVNLTDADLSVVDVASDMYSSILLRIDGFPSFPFNYREQGTLVLFPTPDGWKVRIRSITHDFDHMQEIIDQAKSILDTDEAGEYREEMKRNLPLAEAILNVCRAHAYIHSDDLKKIQEYWNGPVRIERAQNLSLSTAL